MFHRNIVKYLVAAMLMTIKNKAQEIQLRKKQASRD